MASKVTKLRTGLAGLKVSEDPHKDLLKVYNRLLRSLEVLPKDYKYRKDTENLINERKQIVESTLDPVEIEKKIGMGVCEELIEQAKMELKLIKTLEEHKPWEPLVEKPNQDQWRWPL